MLTPHILEIELYATTFFLIMIVLCIRVRWFLLFCVCVLWFQFIGIQYLCFIHHIYSYENFSPAAATHWKLKICFFSIYYHYFSYITKNITKIITNFIESIL